MVHENEEKTLVLSAMITSPFVFSYVKKIILFLFYTSYTPFNFSRNEASANIIFYSHASVEKTYTIMITAT